MNIRQILPSAALLSVVSLSLAITPRASAQSAKTTRVVRPTTTVIPPTTNDAGSTTAATVPVGFTQQAITPATDANTPSSQVFSVPFYNQAAYAAAVTTVDSSTAFTNSAATWTANQFAQTGAPYLVHFKSGDSVGRYFLIASNTTNQITVFPRGYNLSTVTKATDTFEIVPASTLGSLFGTTSVPFQTGATAADGDNLYLWNGTSFDVFFHNGTNWKGTGFLGNQNSTILYPDEGVFMLRRGTAPLTLTFIGTVPSTTERSDVVGPASTFVSNRFPTATTLLAYGLQNLPNWLSGATAGDGDNVYLWNGSSWDVYFYNGTNWKATGFLGNLDTTSIPVGSAVFVVRKSTATGTAATLAQALPYSL